MENPRRRGIDSAAESKFAAEIDGICEGKIIDNDSTIWKIICQLTTQVNSIMRELYCAE